MSFLTPLYLLGALTIAAPIVFHLIRRTTKGEVPFSSLLFLTPSPPRLTRRSRLEHWLLLLLRSAALILLTVAFARPFLRQAAGLSLSDSEQSRIAVLIDTSASMRRGDLWSRAQARAAEVIEACRPDDEIAVFAFDLTSRPVLGFTESSALDPSRRPGVMKSLVEKLSPGWGATDLGQAIVDAAGAIENVGDAARRSSSFRRRIVLVSDLQQGSRLEALGGFEWPSDVELRLEPVVEEDSNAGLQLLTGPDTDESAEEQARELRVRVSNNATSRRESFELAWPDGPPIPAYVPPGETRVFRVPRRTGSSSQHLLRLRGDTEDFDNHLYLTSESRPSSTVIYLGRDAPDDPSGLSYYLKRAFEAITRREVKFDARSPKASLSLPPGLAVPLVVLSEETSDENVAVLRRFARDGGTVLFVVSAAGKAPTLSALADVPTVETEDSPAQSDALLSEIAFDHPLFAPFATPQYNDFTKIRFWKYRRLGAQSLGKARVLARFEKGDPAVIEKPIEKGRLVILTSGWNPADSQLARSSKFLPLVSALLENPIAGPDLSATRLVGEPVPMPEGAVAVRKPDGSRVELAPGRSAFEEADAPGIYEVETAKGAREFAVNLDPSESNTTPLAAETLEQYGCRLAANASRVEAERSLMRQMQNAELEGRQKLWRPLILSVLSVLILETWLAGKRGRSRSSQVEAPA
jgi:hypothetical protein